MKIIHKFVENFGHNESERCLQVKSMLDSHNIKYKSFDNLLIVELEESHEKWKEIVEYLKGQNFAITSRWTEFTKKEIKSAHYLKIGSSLDHGYPMPDSDFGYMNITYAPGSCC